MIPENHTLFDWNTLDEFRGSKILSTARPETPFGLRSHCVSGHETFSYPDCRKSFILIVAL